MTCHLPNDALQVHDRQLNFSAIRPADSNFNSLPLGGAIQTYTVSVSNNGRDYGSSQTYTLYNHTCFICSEDGIVQRVSRLISSSVYILFRGVHSSFKGVFTSDLLLHSAMRHIVSFLHNML